MRAELERLRALIITRRPLGRKVRSPFIDRRGKRIEDLVRSLFAPGEHMQTFVDAKGGITIEVWSTAIHEGLLAGKQDAADYLLEGLLRSEFMHDFCRIVILRQFDVAVIVRLGDIQYKLWRDVRREKISHDAWQLAMRRLSRTSDTVERYPISPERAMARMDGILAWARRNPPPARKLVPPRPKDVTPQEAVAAMRSVLTGGERMRLFGTHPWRDIFHNPGIVRIGAFTFTFYKRSEGMSGTVHVRHDDGRASSIERLGQLGLDPFDLLDDDEQVRFCSMLEALEPKGRSA